MQLVIKENGKLDRLYQLSFLFIRTLNEWKIRKKGIKYETLPKISRRKDDKNEPEIPKKLSYSVFFES